MSNLKWLVYALLGSVMLFHFVAIWYVREQRYELTSPDYYQRELGYQETIERYRAGEDLQWQVSLDAGRGRLSLQARDRGGANVALEDLTGRLYRPNAAGMDRDIALEAAGDGSYVAIFEPLAGGRWNLTLEGTWQGRAVAYRERAVL